MLLEQSTLYLSLTNWGKPALCVVPNTLGREADFPKTPKASLNLPPTVMSRELAKRSGAQTQEGPSSEPAHPTCGSRAGIPHRHPDVAEGKPLASFPVSFPHRTLPLGPMSGRQRML